MRRRKRIAVFGCSLTSRYKRDLCRALNIAAEEFNPECDPNQIETTYPPRRRRLWVWIVILLLLAALVTAAYIFITNGSISLGAIGIK